MKILSLEYPYVYEEFASGFINTTPRTPWAVKKARILLILSILLIFIVIIIIHFNQAPSPQVNPKDV